MTSSRNRLRQRTWPHEAVRGQQGKANPRSSGATRSAGAAAEPARDAEAEPGAEAAAPVEEEASVNRLCLV